MSYCSVVLAHIFGVLGCALCVVGSITIALHAPQERAIESVIEVWDPATEPCNNLFYLIFGLNAHLCKQVFTFFPLSFCSFYFIWGAGVSSCFYTCLMLYPVIWSYTCNVLHWSLFSSRFFVGM